MFPQSLYDSFDADARALLRFEEIVDDAEFAARPSIEASRYDAAVLAAASGESYREL
tara:strand:+ start:121 stop:291 length:171 start_codon:yes stop_codon:yes gene_type:complete